MKPFEIADIETLEKVLDLVARNEDYRRADSDVKQRFLKDIHEQIVRTAYEKALDELYPTEDRKKARRRPAKTEEKNSEQ